MSKIFLQIFGKKNREYLILSMIVFTGFLLRVYKLDSPLADWHSFRQADTSSVTRVYLEDGINLLYPRYHDLSSTQSGKDNLLGLRFVEFPLYNLAHYLIAVIFPFFNLEEAGRLTSILASLWSLFFIYLICKKIYNKKVAILASLFFAILPFNIYFSRTILPEPLAILLALMAIFSFILFLEQEKLLYLFLGSLAFASSLLVKPFTIFYAAPIIYLAIRKYLLIRKYTIGLLLRQKTFWLSLFLTLAPLFLWRIWILQHPEAIPRISWMFNEGSIRFRPAFFRWIFGERIGLLILGMWGLVPFSLALTKINKKTLFVIFWFLAEVLYLTIFAAVNVRHDYYQIYLLSPISILLSLGVVYLWEDNFFNKFASRILVVFSVFMMLGMSAYQVKEFYKINHPEIIEAGRALDMLVPKDALVIAAYNGDTAFLYQTKRKGWPVVDDSFENLIKKGASFYISVNLNDPDTLYLSQNFPVLKKTEKFIIIQLTR